MGPRRSVLPKLFAFIDRDGDGRISEAEWVEIFDRVAPWPKSITAGQLRLLTKSEWVQHGGAHSTWDAITVGRFDDGFTKDDWKSAFATMDADRSGSITSKEWRKVEEMGAAYYVAGHVPVAATLPLPSSGRLSARVAADENLGRQNDVHLLARIERDRKLDDELKCELEAALPQFELEERGKLPKIFSEVDVDGSGTLSRVEWSRIFDKIGTYPSGVGSGEQMKLMQRDWHRHGGDMAIWATLRTELGRGGTTTRRHGQATCKQDGFLKDEWMRSFAMLDKDNDGEICVREWLASAVPEFRVSTAAGAPKAGRRRSAADGRRRASAGAPQASSTRPFAGDAYNVVNAATDWMVFVRMCAAENPKRELTWDEWMDFFVVFSEDGSDAPSGSRVTKRRWLELGGSGQSFDVMCESIRSDVGIANAYSPIVVDKLAWGKIFARWMAENSVLQHELDADGDGSVTKQEWLDFFKEFTHETQLSNISRRDWLARGGDEKFLAKVLGQSEGAIITRELWMQYFELVDRDGSGNLEEEEWQAMVQGLPRLCIAAYAPGHVVGDSAALGVDVELGELQEEFGPQVMELEASLAEADAALADLRARDAEALGDLDASEARRQWLLAREEVLRRSCGQLEEELGDSCTCLPLHHF